MRIINVFTALLFIMALASCKEGSRKDSLAVLNDKKTELAKLTKERDAIDDKIAKVKEEITQIDGGASLQKPKLVRIDTIQTGDFNHFIELQGVVDAENISFVTPRSGGGQIQSIHVRQGQQVRKGQLLLRLDNAVQRQNLVAARQGLQTIRTQLAYAKNVYDRQKNLWDNNIGTEVQLITAKNNVATLENQLSAAQENVKVVQEQVAMSNVYSDVNGVADVVTVKVGEIFTGNPMGGGVIKIVNKSDLKVTSNVPENYLSNVKTGSPVEVYVPDMGRTFNTSVSFIGASIDPNKRGFTMEARLPGGSNLSPNQVAVVKIKDYSSSGAIVVPVNTLQNDENGKYVLVARNENGKMVARKKQVAIGALNGDMLEIRNGLTAGDVLITEGYHNLYDGQLITI